MAREHRSVAAIVNKRICVGCGACSVICRNSCITHTFGKRFNFPTIESDRCNGCGMCLKVCPSTFLLEGRVDYLRRTCAETTNTCYLGHSTDETIRLHGSSGGFITGLTLDLLERGLIDGAIVAKTEGNNPLVAASFIAADRESLIQAIASKYAPVSSCMVLKDVMERPGKYAFVGTPCMIEALKNLQTYLPILKERIVLTIGLVCAGMSTRLATRGYIEDHGGVDMGKVHKICYRGNGWPGRFRVFAADGSLLMDRPLLGGSLIHVVGGEHYLRCSLCLDHWGKQADVVVSDPWCEEMVRNETKGWSAVLTQSDQGRDAVISAVASGSVNAREIDVKEMFSYNSHLILGDSHPRAAWIALYQLVFFGRLCFLRLLLQQFRRGGRIEGFRTILKARLNRNYYS